MSLSAFCLLLSALAALLSALAARRQAGRLGRALLAADGEARRLAAEIARRDAQKDPTLPDEFEGFILQPLCEPGEEMVDVAGETLCPVRFAPAQLAAAWDASLPADEREEVDFTAAIAQASTVAKLNLPTEEACFGAPGAALDALRRGGSREELIAAGAAPIEAEEMLRLARQCRLAPAPAPAAGRHLASI